MKFLLIPSNNSLSHVAKCVALESELSKRGHCVLIAVSHKHVNFLKRLGLAFAVLPDIQESDDGALPSLAWFRSQDFLRACIQAEMDLMKGFDPDRVVGIFRFTLRVSTAILNIPYDAVSCGCMMPDVREVLGFRQNENGASEQALYLDNFFRFAGRRMARVMEALGAAPLMDMRDLLMGDRTFLWDFPQFMPLPERDGRYYIGPLLWGRWPDMGDPPDPFTNGKRPLAVLSLGTRKGSQSVVRKMIRCLTQSGYNVMIACGGLTEPTGIVPSADNVRIWRFAPLEHVLSQAQILVCHGGQMTIFEALLQKVPVLVVPSHPEQAHNGVCIERIKCGRRLSPPMAFKGDIETYVAGFTQQGDEQVMEMITRVASDDRMTRGLGQAQQDLQAYNAPVRAADLLEAV